MPRCPKQGKGRAGGFCSGLWRIGFERLEATEVASTVAALVLYEWGFAVLLINM